MSGAGGGDGELERGDILRVTLRGAAAVGTLIAPLVCSLRGECTLAVLLPLLLSALLPPPLLSALLSSERGERGGDAAASGDPRANPLLTLRSRRGEFATILAGDVGSNSGTVTLCVVPVPRTV